jgi:lipopolysaccharide transport system permease protein
MAGLSKSTWRNIYAYRFALQNLMLKDFRIRYRNMSLGILWSLLNPLIMLGVLVFIFSYVYRHEQSSHFQIFVLLGLIIYNSFTLCLSAATNCIVDNAPLIKKTIFPRIILPLSVILSQLIQVVIQWGLLAVFILLFRVPITSSYLWMPLIFLIQIIFITGTCMICATLNVYYRDVQYLVQSALTILFWFTPIFYSLTTVHENLPRWLYGAYILNPMAGCVDGARKAVLQNSAPDAVAFGTAGVVSLILFFLGFWLFERYQKNFADRL